jgi:hypothetical protein
MATLSFDPLAILADQLDPPANPWEADPVAWLRDRLGGFAWSKQVEILEALTIHKRVAVMSAHDLGKSYIGAGAGCWWVDVHSHPNPEDVFVASTAPSYPQVHGILWEEIRKDHRQAARRHRDGVIDRPLPGEVNQSDVWKINGAQVGYGRKPADTDEHGFQGIHRLYVLALIDEACGVPAQLWTAVEAIITNETSRVLAIGNPDDPNTEFAKVCQPGSGWHVIHMDGLRSPNFTAEVVAGYPRVKALMEEEGIEPSTEWVPDWLRPLLLHPEWVEDKIRRWGPKSPLFTSKVRGLFPEVGDETLISPRLIREAQERELVGISPGRYALDVARFGPDETVAYRNRDGVIRRALSHHKQDTMQTAGRAAQLLEPHGGGVPMVVDTIGVGSGVFDRLRELGLPVVPFDAGGRPVAPEQPGEPRFANRRAEVWWSVRLAFEAGEVDLDPDDEDLAAQLGSIRWWVDSRSRIHIESKDDWRKRMGSGTSSPDRADAVMMTFVAAQPWPPDDASEKRHDTLTGDLLERDL